MINAGVVFLRRIDHTGDAIELMADHQGREKRNVAGT